MYGRHTFMYNQGKWKREFRGLTIIMDNNNDYFTPLKDEYEENK